MISFPQITNPTADSNLVATGITIIYDDRATGLRAKRFGDMLVDSLGADHDGRLACWRSELIDLPEIAEAMARDAAASEFVILSLRGDRGLTVAMKHWVDAWLAQAAGGPSCLIALFDPERSIAPHAGSGRCYLRHAAASAGVAFFAHCTASPNREEAAFFPVDEDEESAARPKKSARSRKEIASFYPATAAA